MSTPHPIRWAREHPRAADGLLAVVVTATALTVSDTSEPVRPNRG